MTPDFRALCVELVRIADALDGETRLISNQGQALDGFSALAAFRDVARRARAALAEPAPPWPTRDEAVAVYTEVMAAHDCQTLGDMAEHFARAVLARWGHQPAPPAAGEVEPNAE